MTKRVSLMLVVLFVCAGLTGCPPNGEVDETFDILLAVVNLDPARTIRDVDFTTHDTGGNEIAALTLFNANTDEALATGSFRRIADVPLDILPDNAKGGISPVNVTVEYVQGDGGGVNGSGSAAPALISGSTLIILIDDTFPTLIPPDEESLGKDLVDALVAGAN